MVEKVFYSDAKDSVVNFVSLEFPALPEKFLVRLYSFFYKFCNYEEEGTKVRPSILICSDIDSIIKAVPNAYKLDLFVDNDESSFEPRVKSLANFCNDDWIVYISYKDAQFTYGICKAMNSIKEKDLSQLLFDEEIVFDNKISMIFIDAVSSYAIKLKGIKGRELQINFTLSDDIIVDVDTVIKRFVSASLQKLKTTKKKLNEIKILQENILKRAFKDIHGTICVIVDKDYMDTGIFSDGIWLREPIDFSKSYLQAKVYSEAQLSTIDGLFIDMLNYDGITIIDNAGRILAYNVFVETTASVSKKILGGARKRAAYTILNSKKKKIIGVYFQSQEGEVFYEEVKR